MAVFINRQQGSRYTYSVQPGWPHFTDWSESIKRSPRRPGYLNFWKSSSSYNQVHEIKINSIWRKVFSTFFYCLESLNQADNGGDSK